jgi:hypothetical protein
MLSAEIVNRSNPEKNRNNFFIAGSIDSEKYFKKDSERIIVY